MTILRLSAMVVVIGLVLAAVSQAAGDEVLRAPSMEPLYKVNPEYPPAALRHRIQGTVRLEALIGKDGHVERSRLLSGHPLLVRAARQAAQHWSTDPPYCVANQFGWSQKSMFSFDSIRTGTL
jgi:TonB family protein